MFKKKESYLRFNAKKGCFIFNGEQQDATAIQFEVKSVSIRHDEGDEANNIKPHDVADFKCEANDGAGFVFSMGLQTVPLMYAVQQMTQENTPFVEFAFVSDKGANEKCFTCLIAHRDESGNYVFAKRDLLVLKGAGKMEIYRRSQLKKEETAVKGKKVNKYVIGDAKPIDLVVSLQNWCELIDIPFSDRR